MSSTLPQRFLAAEDQFLSAFAAGETSLVAFHELWSSLLSDFQVAQESHKIDAQTNSLIHTIASRISVLADTFMSLDVKANEVFDAFQTKLILIHADHDGSPTEQHTITPPASSPSPRIDDLLDYHAAHWLLDNLHNPYPCSSIKASLAQTCRCSVKDVQEWFANARCQIGWTTLSREKFGGSRRRMEAAFRAYRDVLPHGPSSGVECAFATIESNARDLFTPPRDLTLHGMGLEEVKRLSSQSTTLCGVQQELSGPDVSGDVTESLFSDNHSSAVVDVWSPSPMTTLIDEEDTSPPPPIAGRKRRLESQSEAAHEKCVSEPFGTRGNKRLRSMFLTSDEGENVSHCDLSKKSLTLARNLSTHAAVQCSPHMEYDRDISSSRATHDCQTSPSLSVPSRISLRADVAAPLAPTACAPVVLNFSRKRRLSDAAPPESSKRPRGLVPGPRKQTVSDPLPVNLNSNETEILGVDEWLQSSWGVPDAINPGDSTPAFLFEVEHASCSATSSASTSSMPSPVSYLDVSDADLVSATCDGFDFSAFNFSDLLTPSNPDFCDDHSLSSSVGSSCSSPSVNTSPELSKFSLVDNFSQDWTQDLNQFVDLIDSLDSSLPSETSLSNGTTSFQTSDSVPNPDDITHALFGMDPSFTSPDNLTDIGGFSSLLMPLGAIL